MKTKRMLHVLAAVVCLSAAVQGAIVTFHGQAPTPGPLDVYSLVGVTQDRNNVGTATTDGAANDATTYVAFDRAAQGQTFVTGGTESIYMLSGIWVQHTGYTTENTVSTWYAWPVGSQMQVRITNPAASGTANFVLASETTTFTGTEPNILPVGTTNNVTGTGTWIYIALESPVPLSPNTLYGFDVTAIRGTANLFFETMGIKDTAPGGNPYPAGSAYTSGGQGAAGTVLTKAPGDRVFIVELLALPPATASLPSPADKAVGVPWDAVLSWNGGFHATGSRVFFGTSPDSLVPEANVPHTPDVERYSHTVTGLDMSRVYYWRVDQVQTTGPDVTGDVWSFTTGTTKATVPSPFNHQIAVFTDPNLTWTQGIGSTESTVYFGTSPGALEQRAVIPHTPGVEQYSLSLTGLEHNTEYYWRVDEKEDGAAVVTGDVWHFTTIPVIPISDPALVGWWKFDEGSSVAIDWSGLNQHGLIQGNAAYAGGYDGSALVFDGMDDYVELPIGETLASLNSTTLVAWVNFTSALANQRIFDFGIATGPDAAPDVNVYMFLSRTDTAGSLRFAMTTSGAGGEQGVNSTVTVPAGSWHHVGVSVDEGTGTLQLYVDGAAAGTGSTQILPSAIGDRDGNWLGKSKFWDPPDPLLGGLIDDFRIYNKVLTEQELAKAMRGDPLLAWSPSPAKGALTDARTAFPLAWSAGDEAVQHDVYLGTDADAVGQAVASDTTGIYRGRQAATTYTPAEAAQWGQTYAWRVDEIQANGTLIQGPVWTFAVADHLIADDFEAYDDECNRIFFHWIDGYGHSGSTACTVPPGQGNGTGSTVGNINPPFAERTIVHSGLQALPFAYDNTIGGGISETTRTFDPAQDWTSDGVTTLVLFFRGDTANGPGEIYVKINGSKVVYDGPAEAISMGLWKQWNIDLASVSGTDLTAVQTLTFGVAGSGGSGILQVDDIRLYPVAPAVPIPVDPGTSGLSAYYPMDGDVKDGSGKGYHGTLNNDPVFVDAPVGFGQALRFDGLNDYVDLPIGELVSTLTSATIATRVNFDTSNTGSFQRIFDFGTGMTDYLFLTPRVGTTGVIRAAIRDVTHAESLVNSPTVMPAGWHHVAVAIDGVGRTLQLYLDGDLVASGPTSVLLSDLGVTTQNWLGRSQWAADAYLAGELDEFRIYNRTLSPEEVRYLAGDRAH